ncbi:hypothetical protein ALQ64_02831 [Pseudomonas cannabina]|uniref:Uncharacterized protein n=1 Tax=Pseudomonas cannabina TaxID=86840 RepID=A0A3M3KEJ6_PSECA|nr:hypothetical protein [Pseudomonas cannabina]RMN21103.1 hypothetical protein ALQ64_02831 [Pseudomonas cannabina]
MTSLIQQLHESGEVRRNGCVLIVKSDRYHMSKDANVHSIDVEGSCEARLVAHWLGFVENVGDAQKESELLEVVAKKVRRAREYLLFITCADQTIYEARNDGDGRYYSNIFACNRNEAMKQGRDIVRENVGPYGPKMKIKVRLATPFEQTAR